LAAEATPAPPTPPTDTATTTAAPSNRADFTRTPFLDVPGKVTRSRRPPRRPTAIQKRRRRRLGSDVAGRRSLLSGRGEWLARPVGPLLEGGAATVLTEADHPQVSILELRGAAVLDLHADDRDVVLQGDDSAVHCKRLIGAFALGLPHLGNRVESDQWLLVRRLPVGRILGKELAQ